MALGCACKLYTLHTVGYRNNIRLSQTVQSAAAAAAAAPLLTRANSQIPTVAALPSGHHSSQTPTDISTVSQTNATNNTAPNSHRSTSTGLINNFSNIFRRNNSSNTSPETDPSILSANQSMTEADVANGTTNANNGYQFNFNTTSNSTGSGTNSVPPGELPLPHHLIAPPTYNQTMGLVDEYEQRQLAFIEHVRSILAQQQSQNGGSSGSSGLNLINLNSAGQSSFSALTLIPTVTSSSTTVHRVSSSSRRSHSGRRHRNHYHNRSSSNNVDSMANQAGGAANGANSMSDQMNTIVSGAAVGSASGSSGSGSSRSHRSHRHHYRHSNHSQARGHNIHHHITNNLTQVNFDANRRGKLLSSFGSN